MKTSTEIRAEIASLELARRLATMGGNVEIAHQARAELLALYGELDRRTTANAEQARLYKKALIGGR